MTFDFSPHLPVPFNAKTSPVDVASKDRPSPPNPHASGATTHRTAWAAIAASAALPPSEKISSAALTANGFAALTEPFLPITGLLATLCITDQSSRDQVALKLIQLRLQFGLREKSSNVLLPSSFFS